MLVVGALPPVWTQLMLPSLYPGSGLVSETVFVLKVMMFPPKFCDGSVLALLSVSEKVVGVRFVAVKLKAVELGTSACLITVTWAGKITASAESDRSWFPPEPSRLSSRVWYGDPEIATAELFAPQSARVAMWPPHARTGSARLAVNVIASPADLSPTKPAPVGYVYELTLVIVPPYIVKRPACCVTPAPATC